MSVLFFYQVWEFKLILLQYFTETNVCKGENDEIKMRIFSYHEYKDLMIINDNWYFQDMYFDLDSYGWNL